VAGLAIAFITLFTHTDRLLHDRAVRADGVLVANVLFVQAGHFLFVALEAVSIISWHAHALILVNLRNPFAVGVLVTIVDGVTGHIGLLFDFGQATYRSN
jgi:hypothetical protein